MVVNPKGRALRDSKRAKSSAPSTLPTTDHHLSNLPFIPLLKIMRFLDAPSLEKIRCGSRNLNEFVVLNRSRLVWRRFRSIRMTRSIDFEQKIVYHVEMLSRTYQMHEDFFKTKSTKGSPSTSFALMWLATNFPNCYIEELDLRLFYFDDEDYHEVAQTMVERKLRIAKLILQSSVFRVDLISFIRFLNTINTLKVRIRQLGEPGDLQPISFDEKFFTYMSKLVSLKIRDNSRPMMLIPVPVLFDKIPKKFYTCDVFVMPLSTVLNAIREWCNGYEEFGCWAISVSRDECPNLQHLAKALELEEPYCVDADGEKLSLIHNRGGKKINVSTALFPDMPTNVMYLSIQQPLHFYIR